MPSLEKLYHKTAIIAGLILVAAFLLAGTAHAAGTTVLTNANQDSQLVVNLLGATQPANGSVAGQNNSSADGLISLTQGPAPVSSTAVEAAEGSDTGDLNIVALALALVVAGCCTLLLLRALK